MLNLDWKTVMPDSFTQLKCFNDPHNENFKIKMLLNLKKTCNDNNV